MNAACDVLDLELETPLQSAVVQYPTVPAPECCQPFAGGATDTRQVLDRYSSTTRRMTAQGRNDPSPRYIPDLNVPTSEQQPSS